MCLCPDEALAAMLQDAGLDPEATVEAMSAEVQPQHAEPMVAMAQDADAGVDSEEDQFQKKRKRHPSQQGEHSGSITS